MPRSFAGANRPGEHEGVHLSLAGRRVRAEQFPIRKGVLAGVRRSDDLPRRLAALLPAAAVDAILRTFWMDSIRAQLETLARAGYESGRVAPERAPAGSSSTRPEAFPKIPQVQALTACGLASREHAHVFGALSEDS